MNFYLILAPLLVRVASAAESTADAVAIPSAAHNANNDARISLTEPRNRILSHALSSVNCGDGEQVFRIDLTTDNYGYENEWKVLKKVRRGRKELFSGPQDGRNYGPNQSTVGLYCLTPGKYRFVITDKFKDGMCCEFGEGKYVGRVGKTVVFSSVNDRSNWERRVHRFEVVSPPSSASASADAPPSPRPTPPPTPAPTPRPTPRPSPYPTYAPTGCDDGRPWWSSGDGCEPVPSSSESADASSSADSQDWDDGLPFDPRIPNGVMTQREQDWLNSHNSRRREWHRRYKTKYVPLKWSRALMRQSQTWANKLARDCELEHDQNSEYGENIALNYGWGRHAQMRTTENILTRFVEDEADDDYPANGHLTQVLWRATTYVGCADASRPRGSGTCHTQVCRYSKPGNCNMSRHKSNSNRKEWWLTPMLMDDSPCGKECPPDGCT